MIPEFPFKRLFSKYLEISPGSLVLGLSKSKSKFTVRCWGGDALITLVEFASDVRVGSELVARNPSINPGTSVSHDDGSGRNLI